MWLQAMAMVLGSCANGASEAPIRWETEHGAVHAWCAPRAEELIVYVHGYRDSVDSAVSQHHLFEQFEASAARAIFVAVEAPSGPREVVRWDHLDDLKSELTRVLGALPTRTRLVGHSGAYRTLSAWLREGSADELIVLDGLYGGTSTFERWLQRTPGAAVTLVSEHTAPQARAWLDSLPRTLRSRVRELPAQCSHMAIVTDGRWIPALLSAGQSPSARR